MDNLLQHADQQEDISVTTIILLPLLQLHWAVIKYGLVAK